MVLSQARRVLTRKGVSREKLFYFLRGRLGIYTLCVPRFLTNQLAETVEVVGYQVTVLVPNTTLSWTTHTFVQSIHPSA